MMQRKSLKDD